MHTPPVRAVVGQRIAAVTVAVLGAGLLFGMTEQCLGRPRTDGRAGPEEDHRAAVEVRPAGPAVRPGAAAAGQHRPAAEAGAAAAGHLLGRFSALQSEIARIAVNAYETGNTNASFTLLTSGKPQEILDQSSILEELSASNKARIGQFLAAARQLEDTQQLAKRTKAGIVQLKAEAQQAPGHAEQDARPAEVTAGQAHPAAAGDRRRRTRHGHDHRPLHRADGNPGREGGGVRLRPARLPVRVRRHRPVQRTASTVPA